MANKLGSVIYIGVTNIIEVIEEMNLSRSDLSTNQSLNYNKIKN